MLRCPQGSAALQPSRAAPRQLGAWRLLRVRSHQGASSCSTSPSAAALSGAGAQQELAALSSVQLEVPTAEAMAALGALLASSLRRGDVYLLRGEVGAGKSVLSRAFVRAALGEPTLPVPSPTFLLVNSYELLLDEDQDHAAPQAIHHYDLYRLQPGSSNPAGSFERLGVQAAFAADVCLVEWPERLPEALQPPESLSVHISIARGDSALPQGPPQPASPQLNADDEEEDPFSDQRARRVTLRAQGQGWEERLAALLRDGLGGAGAALPGGLRVAAREPG